MKTYRFSNKREIDEDGYEIVPEMSETKIKGVKCGKCGFKVERGVLGVYFSCLAQWCPLGLGPTLS